MKTHLSLNQLAAEITRRADAKQDYLTDTTNLVMTDDAKIQFTNGETKIMDANEIAHGQIADRLNIPAKYYNRLKTAAPQLLAQNVNHFFNAEPEKRMVRTLDGNVRAFLSDRFARIENEEIAQTVLPLLLEQEGVRIESAAITESRMYIKAVFTKIEGEVSNGDVIQAGVAISNSEVGMGAVKIEPLVFRLVCLNGMISQDSKFTARHVGRQLTGGDNVHHLLSNEALQAEDHAVLLKVRDVVRASFSDVQFQRQLTMMREATQVKMEGNPVDAVKALAKKHTLNDFEEGNILKHLIEGADLSQYGLLNAVTRTAQDVDSYDRATELEALGGHILTLPRSEWKVLQAAA